MGELKASDSVLLNYPVDYVYRTVTDIVSYSEWWPHEVKSELEYLDPAIIGTRINVQNGPFVKWKSVISGFRTNRLLAIDYVDGAWTGKTAWRFEETPEGTKLTMEIDINCNRLWLRAVSKVINLSRMHTKQVQGIFRNLNNYLAKHFEEYNRQHSSGVISVSHLNNVSVSVRDIDASCRFYKDVFRVENVSGMGDSVTLKFGNQKIRLVRRQGEETHPAGINGNPAPNEAIFSVALNTPLGKVKSILKEKGIDVILNTESTGGGDIFFIKDPDGHLIELTGTKK